MSDRRKSLDSNQITFDKLCLKKSPPKILAQLDVMIVKNSNCSCTFRQAKSVPVVAVGEETVGYKRDGGFFTMLTKRIKSRP